jgi:class 3 adenylate cyclase
MGLHSGECLVREAEVRGPAVEVALEIMKAAEDGEVWLSHTVKDLVVGAGFSFEDRGEVEIGGGLGKWRVFRAD